MKEERNEVRQIEKWKPFVGIRCTMNIKCKRRCNVVGSDVM
jgi:hypothetical protein